MLYRSLLPIGDIQKMVSLTVRNSVPLQPRLLPPTNRIEYDPMSNDHRIP
jgi:hypothetical protein